MGTSAAPPNGAPPPHLYGRPHPWQPGGDPHGALNPEALYDVHCDMERLDRALKERHPELDFRMPQPHTPLGLLGGGGGGGGPLGGEVLDDQEASIVAIGELVAAPAEVLEACGPGGARARGGVGRPRGTREAAGRAEGVGSNPGGVGR